MTEDIAEIAGKLTKADILLVKASGPDDITGEEGCGVEIRGARYRTAKRLSALGIGSYTHGSPFYDMYWNLPLGLAVREYLKGQSQ